MSMRPVIFFFFDPEVWTAEEEVEGGVIGDLLGVGVGAGASDRGAGVGGAKGLPEVEGGGLEAASASASCDQSMPWGSSTFFCFFTSLDLFFLRAFLALFLATLSSSSLAFFLEACSSSVIVLMSVAPKGCSV